jgi:hypothetical protein
MDELPPADGGPSRVSMRWPPLEPKNESGCRRLSRKELSSGASVLLALAQTGTCP